MESQQSYQQRKSHTETLQALQLPDDPQWKYDIKWIEFIIFLVPHDMQSSSQSHQIIIHYRKKPL